MRWKLGELLGWDGPDASLGSRVPMLRDRLPEDLRDASSGPDFDPFTSLYLLGDEFAVEMANQTVHAVMHIGWVPDGAGGYRGQIAVLVKANGLLGTAYMATIKPFRYLIVYPALTRQIGREWRARGFTPLAWGGGGAPPLGSGKAADYRRRDRASQRPLRPGATPGEDLGRTVGAPRREGRAIRREGRDL